MSPLIEFRKGLLLFERSCQELFGADVSIVSSFV